MLYRESDNAYLNISMSHLPPVYGIGTVSGEEPILAQFNVCKNTPFLSRASDYYLSIIKFDIPLTLVPLVIMPIIPNQGNPNLTPMIIGITYLGVNYPVNLIFQPEDLTQQVPIQNETSQVITPYYYMYSYETMLRMINVALNSAWIASGLAAANPALHAPFVYLNDATQLISFVINSVFVAPGAPTIFMNNAMFNYLGAFENILVGYNQPQGLDRIFVFNGNLSPSPSTFYNIGVVQYYQYVQDYSTLASWAVLRKLLITSATLPVTTEYVPSSATGDPASNATMPVVSDFTPQITSIGDQNSIAYYVRGQDPLQQVDLQIFWQDSQNNVYPLFIPQYQQANIKIAFVKKTLYNRF
jgi:hypothetical protein